MPGRLASFWLLLLWRIRRYRSLFVLTVLIQLALGLGIVYGLAYLIPHVDAQTALFLSTGAPTLALLLLGLTVVPQEMAQDKLTGAHDYTAALPVPRLTSLAADLSYWLAAQLPGTVLTLIVASWRFHFGLHVSGYVVPAFLLVALSGAAIGYAMSSVLRPEVTATVASFVSVGILLFSPVDFPADRLPAFLQVIQAALPVQYMADLVRWSLTGAYVEHPGLSFVVVGAWCVASLGVSYAVASRRR